ncbi:MarR family winged helix-turn-helix transcriptional regulator [Caldimonas tepidiphila]|uniref:MarR family winged helix-turn-helix transcriptional regulator n=1 Tax=Caldimonas tepidiphila TaxID=2315841 RepID=UPI001F0C3F9A|nr:MarR family transcriptional regulator [Caldimonas tepidiphila]
MSWQSFSSDYTDGAETGKGDRYTAHAMSDTSSPADAHRSPGGLDHSRMLRLLGYNLAQADIPAKKAFIKYMGPLGLRPVEYTVLTLVMSNENVTQKQLSQALSVSAPNMTLLLDRLEERRLISRTRSEADRRMQIIALTEQGQELMRRAEEISVTMEKEILRHLTPAERAILFELLQKVAAHRRV